MAGTNLELGLHQSGGPRSQTEDRFFSRQSVAIDVPLSFYQLAALFPYDPGHLTGARHLPG